MQIQCVQLLDEEHSFGNHDACTAYCGKVQWSNLGSTVCKEDRTYAVNFNTTAISLSGLALSGLQDASIPRGLDLHFLGKGAKLTMVGTS